MENAGPGSRGVENTGSGGKHGGLVENTGSGGKHGISVEKTGSQWKTRGLSAKHSRTILSPNNEI